MRTWGSRKALREMVRGDAYRQSLTGEVPADLLARLAPSHQRPTSAQFGQKEEAPGTGPIPRASTGSGGIGGPPLRRLGETDLYEPARSHRDELA